jgi:hypothetical protein
MSGSVTDASAAPRRSPWYLEVADALAVGERNRRITPARTSEFIAMTTSCQSWSTSRRRSSGALMSSTFQRLGEVNWRF